ARVIHNRSLEWLKIKEAVEKTRDVAVLEVDEVGEIVAAEKTSAALGNILMLDLVIKNEDHLPCRYLQWHGNSANLLLADKMATANQDTLEDAFDSAIKRCIPRVIRALQKDRGIFSQ
ncbi:dual specificity protein phosphatase PHS1, partial [Tanacetum coccineum]